MPELQTVLIEVANELYLHAPGMSVSAEALLSPYAVAYQPDGEPVMNPFPPRKLIPNIIPTLEILFETWLHFDRKGVIVHSCWRSPAYNATIGGSKSSLHKDFNAIDFSIVGVNPSEVADYLESHHLAVTTGVGRYSSFTHLDTRGAIGREAPARWTGNSQ